VSDKEHEELVGGTRAGGKRGLVRACAVLTLTLLTAFPLFAWFGFERSGQAGVAAAAVAGAVCWFGALAALVLVARARDSAAAVNATLIGMFLRLGLPLVTGILLQQSKGELAQAGVFGMILCYYFVALTVETILSVQLIGNKSSVAKA
jgi:hypothetical protein